MKNCKTLLTLLLALLLASAAAAEGFDVTKYSYEELLRIRDAANESVQAMADQFDLETIASEIVFEEQEVLLFKGSTYKLAPTVQRAEEDAPEKTKLAYSSSDSDIAKVSAGGIITAVSDGDCIITCFASDDESIFAELPVHVALNVTSVTLDTSEAELLLTESDSGFASISLTASVLPENAHVQAVTWSSSDESIAIVDENGYVEAIAPGSVTITAKSDDEVGKNQRPKSASCKIKVLRAVDYIEQEQTEYVLNKGKAVTLSAAVLPKDASVKALSWTSTDPQIASVTKEGKVSAKSCGECQIICEATDGSGVSAAYDITVIKMATSVSLGQKTLSLNMDTEMVLKPVFTPSDTTIQDLVFASSDPDVVDVADDGTITAVSVGSATITCTTVDGSEKSASLLVTVPSISIDFDEYTVTDKEGETFFFSYYGDPGTLKVTSASKGVVTLSYDEWATGEVAVALEPQKYGTTTIRLENTKDPKSTRTIKTTVAHSAVYDSTSYPLGSYEDILRNPEDHYGKQIRITGRVREKTRNGSNVTLRVATRGRYDGEFYVEYNPDSMDFNVIEDDRITIYGICLGEYERSSSYVYPYMEAEKIVFAK